MQAVCSGLLVTTARCLTRGSCFPDHVFDIRAGPGLAPGRLMSLVDFPVGLQAHLESVQVSNPNDTLSLVAIEM